MARGEPAGLGIDAEPHDRPPDGAARLVVAGEEAMLRELAESAPGVHWDRVVFSAKESVYKAWSPLTGRWLGFGDVRLSVDPAAGVVPGAGAR